MSSPSGAAPSLDDLRELLPDWRRHLRARNLAPSTETSYLAVAEPFLDWLRAGERSTLAADVGRPQLDGYLVHVADTPNKRTGEPISAAQVHKIYRTLQQLFRWLADVEEIIDDNPFVKMTPPQVPEQSVPIRLKCPAWTLMRTSRAWGLTVA